jgi:hypothetical protein
MFVSLTEEQKIAPNPFVADTDPIDSEASEANAEHVARHHHPDRSTATPTGTVPMDGSIETGRKQAAAIVAAHGGFIPLDSTVALADVEAVLANSSEGLGGDTEPPPTQALPPVGVVSLEVPHATASGAEAPPAGEQNLAATVAFPIDGFDFDAMTAAPPTAAAKTEATPAAAPAPPNGKNAPARELTDKVRDERALAKHQEARRAAILAARLPPSEASSNSNTPVVIVVALLALLLIGAVVFYMVSRPPEAPPEAQPVAVPPRPAAVPAPTAAPAARASASPSSSAGPSTSGSAASTTATRQLAVGPSFATFSVRGRVIPQSDGTIDLEGDPGTFVQVRAAVGSQTQNYTVQITDAGPVPSSIYFHPKPAPARPPKPPATP